MTLRLFSEAYAICKYDKRPALPDGIFFLSETADEISLVCAEDRIPANAQKVETCRRMLRVEGSLDFALVGILARLTGLLAEEKIPVFVVSTFDTDYLLVEERYLDKTLAKLQINGCEILG